MGILFTFWQQMRTWEHPTRVAFFGALALIPILLLLAVIAPASVQTPVLIGLAGILIAIQVIAMWGNRNLVTPYTRAQRLYLSGDLEAARDVLETARDTNKTSGRKPDVDIITLLGNVYRSLGELDASEELLRKAVKIAPEAQFPRYGLGRTLLTKGSYALAASEFELAAQGSVSGAVLFEIGHARYRMGEHDAARAALHDSLNFELEDYRQLMARFWLQKLGEDHTFSLNVLEEGLVFWKAEVQRFRNTPYGQSIEEDVLALEGLVRTSQSQN